MKNSFAWSICRSSPVMNNSNFPTKIEAIECLRSNSSLPSSSSLFANQPSNESLLVVCLTAPVIKSSVCVFFLHLLLSFFSLLICVVFDVDDFSFLSSNRQVYIPTTHFFLFQYVGYSIILSLLFFLFLSLSHTHTHILSIVKFVAF